jgi:uncharacterized protein
MGWMIKIADITAQPLQVEQLLAVPWLEEILSGGNPTGFHPVREQVVNVVVQRMGVEILLQGSGILEMKTECSSCLKVFETKVPVSFRTTLRPKPNQAQALPEEMELCAQELDESFYSGDVLELDDILREQVLLSLPMHPRCSEECRGLCANCGADLNQTQCDCDRGGLDPRFNALRAFVQKQ